MKTEVAIKREKFIKLLEEKGYTEEKKETLLNSFDRKFNIAEEESGLFGNIIKEGARPFIETGVQALNTAESIANFGIAGWKKLTGSEDGYEEYLQKADASISRSRRLLGEEFKPAVDVKDTTGGAIKDMVTTGVEIGSYLAPSPIKGTKTAKALGIKPTKLGGRLAFNVAQGTLEEGARAIGDDLSAGDVAKRALMGGVSQASGSEIFRAAGKLSDKTSSGIKKLVGLGEETLTDMPGKITQKENAKLGLETALEQTNNLIKDLSSKISTDEITDPKDIIDLNIALKDKADLNKKILNPIKKTKSVIRAKNLGVEEKTIDNIVSKLDNKEIVDIKKKIIAFGEGGRSMSGFKESEYTEPANVLYKDFLVPLKNEHKRIGEEIQKNIESLPKKDVSIVKEVESFISDIISDTKIGAKINAIDVKGNLIENINPLEKNDNIARYVVDFADSSKAYDKKAQNDLSDTLLYLIKKKDSISPIDINKRKTALEDILNDFTKKEVPDTDTALRAVIGLKSKLLSKLDEISPDFRETNTKYAVLSDTLNKAKSKLLGGSDIGDSPVYKKTLETKIKGLVTEEKKEIIDKIAGTMDYLGIKNKNNIDLRNIFEFANVIAENNKNITNSLKGTKGLAGSLLNMKDISGAFISNYGKLKYGAGVLSSLRGNRNIKNMQAIIKLLEKYSSEAVEKQAKLPIRERALQTISEEFNPAIARGVSSIAGEISTAGKAIGKGVVEVGEKTNIDDLLLNLRKMYNNGELSNRAQEQINRIIRQQILRKK